LEVVADGLGFPEGPVAMADGSVLFVDIKNETLSRLTADGRVEVVSDIPGGPNGAAIGPDGAVYVCNNGGAYNFVSQGGLTIPDHHPANYRGGSIQRVDLATGSLTTLYDRHDQGPLLSPDDLVFDAAGGFWFTDNGIQRDDGMQYGALCYATPDGKSIRRAAVLATPNGVGLSPDGGTVYVSDTYFGRLWALAVDIEGGPGKVKPGPSLNVPGRVVQTLPGLQLLDSLKVEAGGNICVAIIMNGGITAFSPDGKTEHMLVPDPFMSNLCFGGADMQDVWITASGTGKIFKARWPRPGLKLAFNA
jgi:gluconolactonase